MKNTKTKIVLSAIIFLSIAGFVGTVAATGPSLYVSPASLIKTVGNILDVSVGVNASGNKVCAVEGKLVFNNLSCQSITMAGDVNPQSSPTCSNPYFLIGMPNCVTTDKVLFTVSTKAENAGIASINPTNVDIIGEGVSVGSASIGGNYTINAVPKQTPTPTPIPTPASTPTPKITTPAPEKQSTEIPAEVPAVESQNFLLAAISNFITLGTGNNILGIIVLLAIALIIYFAYFYFAKKKK